MITMMIGSRLKLETSPISGMLTLPSNTTRASGRDRSWM